MQTAEGELRIEIPQVREAAEPFVPKLFPKWHSTRLLRSEPLKAMIVGAFVRGLSMRDVESLCEEAGLGKTSKSTVARICSELHERFRAFGRRDLYETRLVALSGPKSRVLFRSIAAVVGKARMPRLVGRPSNATATDCKPCGLGDQLGYSSLRQARGSPDPAFGVRSSRNELYGATNRSGAITV